nr:triple gene block protein 3 [Cole latent virus]
MLNYIVVALICFAAVLYSLTSVNQTCTIIITGESARFQGCIITQEFAEAISKIKPLSSGTLG